VKTLEVNIFGTSNILTIAAQNPYLKRVILFSTSEVYGRHAVNVSEGDDCIVSSPVEPRWSYAASKLVDEHLAFAYFRQHGLPVTVIRPFNIYGPGQLGEGAIKNFIDMALAGKALLIRGLPETVRSWCYITDLVEAVVGCMNNQESVGEIFNIGNPSAVATTQALAELVRELSGNSEVEIQVDPRPHADVMYRVPNIKKAEKILEYFPKIGLREGITSVIDSRKAT
jgi:nucleoside-diphosphate-sugar epimerase